VDPPSNVLASTRLLPFACCLLLLTGGCSALTDTGGSQAVPLDAIGLSNGDDEAHQFRVWVAENGTTVYEETVLLNATTEGESEVWIRSPDAVDGPGKYTVFVGFDGGEPKRIDLTEDAERLRGCSRNGGDVRVAAFVAPSGEGWTSAVRCGET
jgi:hypothetical protein